MSKTGRATKHYSYAKWARATANK